MTKLHCVNSTKLLLCWLFLLTVLQGTNAFSPKPIPPITRISNQFQKLASSPTRTFFSLSSDNKQQSHDHDANIIDKPSSLWTRLLPIKSCTNLHRIQRILPLVSVLLLLPAKAMASDLPLSPLSASQEFRLTLRLIMAAILGAGLGKERSIAKHSAGVRTMALVAMGASAFTVCSLYGFNIFGGGKHDPGRMASQVASGVGFVGAGVITSTSHLNGRNIVHGLTTAATIWLSAAVGVACGTGLYQVATAAAALTIFILRLGRKSTPTSSTQPPPPPVWNHGINSSSRRVIPAELSATPLDWQHVQDDDAFAETHDTAEWDEHHYTVQEILDDEMPPIIQQARKRIAAQNARLSSLPRPTDRIVVVKENVVQPKDGIVVMQDSAKPQERIVVVQDPEIAEIMRHAWQNHTNHQELHIQNMQNFAHYANKTVSATKLQSWHDASATTL